MVPFTCELCGESVDSMAEVRSEKPNVSRRLCAPCHGRFKWAKKRGVDVSAVRVGVRGRIPKPTMCATCGKSTGSSQNKYCGRECQRAGSGVSRYARRCEECGEMFTPSGGKNLKRQRFCSVACRYAEARRRPPKPPRSRVYFPACAICGGVFCAKSRIAKYCSELCRYSRQLAVASDRANSLYQMATQFDRESGRYEGFSWRRAMLQYLVERDGDRCGICNRRVDITLKSGTRGSRRGPSVDHIVPRSLGGTDDPANLRLAHWGCNQKRGNRGGSEQLALVG